MGSITLTELEKLEVEVALLREAYHKERVSGAEVQLKLLRELAGHVGQDKELLFLRLLDTYELAGRKGLMFSPDGKQLLFNDPVLPAEPHLESSPLEEVSEPPKPSPLRRRPHPLRGG